MLPLLRGLLACALVLLPSLAFAQQIWVESFTGMSGSEKPNGYRYNVGVFGDPIQVFFNYTRISATAVSTPSSTVSRPASAALSRTSLPIPAAEAASLSYPTPAAR